MTIRENLDLINDTLNRSYDNLQKLAYEEETEKVVRIKLYDITSIARDLFTLINLKEMRQRQGKNKLKRKQV